MQLWRTIKSWFDPTAAWQEDASIPLVVNLDDHTFCGIRVGDSFQKLSFLGPPREGVCGPAWPKKGLEVGLNEGAIREFCIFLSPPSNRSQHFAGSFILRGQPLAISDQWTEPDLKTFGEAYRRDVDRDESILFYEFGSVEWQVELDLNGRLKAIVIGEPIVADSAQRESYGVTKPWPPQR